MGPKGYNWVQIGLSSIKRSTQIQKKDQVGHGFDLWSCCIVQWVGSRISEGAGFLGKVFRDWADFRRQEI